MAMSRRTARRLAPLVAAVAAVAAPSMAGAAIALAPQVTGSFGTGSGASATFLQIDSGWKGSTVLWNEGTHSYGSGSPIGSLAWGTGLWGRADFDTVQSLYATSGCAAPIVNCWNGLTPTINFGNAVYNAAYDTTWGPAASLPGRVGGENWTAHFTGFIRITDAGNYNFSVLHDDGFFFRLIGAGGSALDIGRDFLNPRDRVGFADDLLLSPGLYGFELGMWNRLEAGVVDLRWMFPGGGGWTLVPTEHLLPAGAVPEPATAALAALGLALLGASRRRAGG